MRNVSFMGASTGIRLLFGLLSFGIMARELGAEEFGRVMTALAAAVLAGLVINFGFATYALREIGAASREEERQIMAGVLSAKLLLSAVVLCAGLLVFPFLPHGWRALLAVMLLAQVLDAVTDLLNVGFRATGRFAQETRVATVSAVIQFGFIAGSVALVPQAMVAAGAYCFARFVIMVITWREQSDYFSGLQPAPLREGLVRLRAARSFAADHCLQSLFGQIDSIVLAHYFGPAAVSIYQAGMRLFLGGAQSASVLANVVIPRLSALRSHNQATRRDAVRSQAAFVGVGIAGGFVLALLPSSMITFLLGREFDSLYVILPWFGLLFVVRLTGYAWGVLLTVHGQQFVRVVLTTLHWGVVATVAALTLPGEGLNGWLMSLVVGNAALALGYAIALKARTRENLALWPTLASLTSCAALASLVSQRAA